MRLKFLALLWILLSSLSLAHAEPERDSSSDREVACSAAFQAPGFFSRWFSRKNPAYAYAHAPLFGSPEGAKALTKNFFHSAATFQGIYDRKTRKQLLASVDSVEKAYFDPEAAMRVYGKAVSDVKVIDAVEMLVRDQLKTWVKYPKKPHSTVFYLGKKTLLVVAVPSLIAAGWIGLTQIPVALGFGAFQPVQADTQKMSYRGRALLQGLALRIQTLNELGFDHSITDAMNRLQSQAILTDGNLNFLELNARWNLSSLSIYLTSLQNTLAQNEAAGDATLREANLRSLILMVAISSDLFVGPYEEVAGHVAIVKELFRRYDPGGMLRSQVSLELKNLHK